MQAPRGHYAATEGSNEKTEPSCAADRGDCLARIAGLLRSARDRAKRRRGEDQGRSRGPKEAEAAAKDAAKEAEAFVLAAEAYVYAYPLVTMEMTRRVITNVAQPEGTRAPMDPKAHWDGVYTRKAAAELSWYQPHDERSLRACRARCTAPPGV